MNAFKRKVSTFQGGEARKWGGARFVELGEQPVIIIGPHTAPNDEDEDQFIIQAYNIPERLIVDGCDLHPHPNAPATNAEFMAWLTESASPNPLMQAFVPEAVAKYAEFCLQDGGERYKKQAGDQPLVNPTSWLGVAQEALDAINANYKGR